MNKATAVFKSESVLYFIIAFEVLIMISPFAGFFYSVFNPFLLETAKYSATRWLSAFYLPHMILSQDWFLQFVRVMGSVMFVLGAATSDSPLCHVSVGKWMKASGYAIGSPERRDRCARVTASAAYHLVQDLECLEGWYV